MIDWKIRTRSSQCHSCDVPFEDGQAYHTLLFSEREEHHRIDVCRDCWDSQYGEGASDRKGYVSHWYGTYMVPPPPPPEPIQKETADSALRKLLALEDETYGPVCFILATMLERKRLLKVREEIRTPTDRGFVYENPRTGEIFTINDPELKLDELQDVQRDVSLLLEKGIDVFLHGEPTEEESVQEGATAEGTEGAGPGRSEEESGVAVETLNA